MGSAQDVLRLYAQARAQFPNAAVRSASLDDVARSLLRPEVRSKLPVLDMEVNHAAAPKMTYLPHSTVVPLPEATQGKQDPASSSLGSQSLPSSDDHSRPT